MSRGEWIATRSPREQEYEARLLDEEHVERQIRLAAGETQPA